MSRNIFGLILLLALLLASPSSHAELYQWTDENGVTHFASSLGDVPEKYRSKVKVIGGGDPPASKSIEEKAPAKVPASMTTPAPADELTRFEIPYQAYEGTARRVILPVTFNNRETVMMAIDTGSPGMVISFELAVELGILSRDSGTLLTDVGGIGGSQLGILTIVDSVSIGEARDNFIPTTVTARISDAFEGLIGMDFLANYTISIDSQREVVVFEERQARQNSRGGRDEAWWRNQFREFRQARDFWRERAKGLDSRSRSSTAELIRFQAREAERLLQRLDLHASNNAVPRHWR